MIDFRLYRFAWIPAAVAAVVLMFSFAGAPDALEPATPAAALEGERAASDARRIASRAPVRTPGSEGDETIADLVAERFSEIPAGLVDEQRFETKFDGDDISARNVVLTLPADRDEAIVIVAARDAAEGAGAATSAAATGSLLELASSLGVASHNDTFVLASTSGGADGIARLIDELADRGPIEAVILIFQPGVAEPSAPYVLAGSINAKSGSVQLERTAELAVENQAQLASSEPGALAQLARLAFPAGLGPEAPLVADGIDAVTISAAGERPLSGAAAEALDRDTLDAFTRAAHATINAVDTEPAPLEHGPGTHLELGDNLISGWTLSLLALTLWLPAAVVVVHAGVRAWRSGWPVPAGLAWAGARALPLIGALAALYALTLVGIVPRPGFPFDPSLHELGARGWICFFALAAAAGLSAYLLREVGITAQRAPPTAAIGLGATACLAVLVIWLGNPYLGLLAVPVAHVWLLAARDGGLGRAALTIAAAVAAVAIIAATFASVAGTLDLGGDGPWFFTLLVAGGQIPIFTALAGCFAASSLLGACALAVRRGGGAPDAA